MIEPIDHFPPHGYLDNPSHTRNLNPSGVIRSTSGIGFGWHYPALAKGYGYREIYSASLNLALTIDGQTYYLHEDFPGLFADIHTKNRVRYCWQYQHLRMTAIFWRVGDNALACRAKLISTQDCAIRLTAFTGYTRHLGAAGVWGESGLVGHIDGSHLIVQGFEDGTALALAGDCPFQEAGCSMQLSTAFLGHPVFENTHMVVTGSRGETVRLFGATAYDLSLNADKPTSLDLVLARDIRRDLAIQTHQTAMRERATALAERIREDTTFWATAPTLEGDWPDHWRRGFIIDQETLRMMVKSPIGVYRHVWDAMQIQAPRVVLAEAAIDALLLGYADLATAKALLLGTFLDAPAANIPCSREDGSYNMVGANGSECGTAPEWGYPAEVAALLYDFAPDNAWLEAIYPGLKAFLEWWLTHRSDAEGYLVYDNSWESGQDLSARFGPQKEGGGSTIRMVRPVDLQAAMASACRTMYRFAGLLGYAEDQASWGQRETRFRTFVAALWHDGAYRDYDARVGWSDVWDVMQLAPVALGLASDSHEAALLPQIQTLADDPYLWPMFVWTATDTALSVKEYQIAATIAHDTIDRAYRYWDSREYDEQGRLPGITCEYWGLDGRCGAEGYGWGAFSIHLIIHTLLGFRPGTSSLTFSLTPNLPPDWRHQGNSYQINNLHCHGIVFSLQYAVESKGFFITLHAKDQTQFSHGGQVANPLRFKAVMGTTYIISVTLPTTGAQ